MRRELFSNILIVSMLIIVLTGLNRAEDRSNEVEGHSTVDATLAPVDIGDRKADSLREARRLMSAFNDIKTQVNRRLREFQGLTDSYPDIVISVNEGGKESISQSPPRMSRKHLPPRVSREEEEWMLLAGELHAENCIELLLNRISNSCENLHLSLKPYGQGPPAFYVLCKMGLPACDAALRRIPLEPDGSIRMMLTRLLQRRLGNAKAKFSLLTLNEACDTEEERVRVRDAIEHCEAIQLPHPMER